MLTQQLDELVSDYENYYITAFDNELYSYNVIDTIDELIKRSIYSDYRFKLSLNKYNECRTSSSSLSDMNNYCKISNVRINLLKCTRFEELLKAMYYPLQIGLITGFNPINIYDSCLRFGVNTCTTLDSDNSTEKDIILPEYIYIYNQYQNGVQNLFQKLNIPYKPKYHEWDNKKEFAYLELNDFPYPLNKLLPYHIENFLSIYEEKL